MQKQPSIGFLIEGIMDFFCSRTALGGRFQILRYKKKIDFRDYFNKTSLFVKNFKINQ